MADPQAPTDPGASLAPAILLVEDDRLAQHLYADSLRAAGFRVSCASSVAAMRSEVATAGPFDLLVVDLGLPDGNGLDTAKALAEAGGPVIAITANDSIEVRIDALEGSALDFLVKPFDERELVARVHNALRARALTQAAPVRFAGFSYAPDSGRLWDSSGREVALSTGERRLLRALVVHHGRDLRRQWLATRLLGRASSANLRVIDVQISRLRRKLGPEGAAIVRTVRLVGYRFETSLTPASGPADGAIDDD